MDLSQEEKNQLNNLQSASEILEGHATQEMSPEVKNSFYSINQIVKK